MSTSTEIVTGVHRIDAEVGGRPLYLFAFLGERHKVEDDAYRVLLAAHETNAGRAFERLTLEKSVAELSRAQADLDARKAERAQMNATRDTLRART